MLVQDILSLITRMIPEAFLMIYSVYKLIDMKINVKNLLISSFIGGTVVYITRLLPIHFGVHTILGIMLYILLLVRFNNIEVYKAIATVFILHILVFISDIILVVLYIRVLNLSSEIIFGQTWVGVLAGIPSLIIFYLLVMVLLYIKKRGFSNE